MLSEVLPEERLRDALFEEIISFRREREVEPTIYLSVERRLGELRTLPDSQEWIVAGRQVRASLRADLQKYQTEFAANRDKIWPGIASSLNSALVSGGIGAVAMSYIGGPGKALLGSIAGASIGILKRRSIAAPKAGSCVIDPHLRLLICLEYLATRSSRAAHHSTIA